MLSAQLIIGGSILKLNDFDHQTYTNKAVIAINQDPLGKQAKLVMQYSQQSPNPYDPSLQQVRHIRSSCRDDGGGGGGGGEVCTL